MKNMTLRNMLYAGAASAALLVAAPAWADVFVQADIHKTKDITVTEHITIDKTINLDVDVNIVPGKAAEATGIINQQNYDNEACGNCAEKADSIVNSLGGGASEGNTGIVNVNQSSGNMNNQGNAVSVAVDFVRPPPNLPPPPDVPPPPPQAVGDPGFANSQAHVEQVNGVEHDGDTSIGSGNLVDTVNLLFRDALIDSSINDNEGIVNVNQSPGSMNNQANLVSLAVSLVDPTTEGGGVALSEADLGQVNSGNAAHESDSAPETETETNGVGGLVGINKGAVITGSIIGNTGITNVNQAAGNMANQANNVSTAAVVVGGL
jgi:hypothetical protein